MFAVSAYMQNINQTLRRERVIENIVSTTVYQTLNAMTATSTPVAIAEQQ